ncbi:DUF4136 domain-containing protein [Sphingorhabdus arenilitoris]|uniref:DUF4136 domain-containing protein n=1 Tax=Sphingorhabdus arenilitoris TaxID=1490041 RepID=A0ABV8RE82_9SPHN
MRLAILSLTAAAVALSACATPAGPVEITRFNRADEGVQYGNGSFAVEIARTDNAGEQAEGTPLSASPYLNAVAAEMQRIGYSENSDNASVIAQVGYGVRDLGKRDRRGPVSVGVGGSTGGYRSGVGVGLGLDLTSLLNRPKNRVLTELSVRIIERDGGRVIWEGSAAQESDAGSAASASDSAAQKLASALFSNFPGKSGESIIVK